MTLDDYVSGKIAHCATFIYTQLTTGIVAIGYSPEVL